MCRMLKKMDHWIFNFLHTCYGFRERKASDFLFLFFFLSSCFPGKKFTYLPVPTGETSGAGFLAPNPEPELRPPFSVRCLHRMATVPTSQCSLFPSALCRVHSSIPRHLVRHLAHCGLLIKLCEWINGFFLLSP